MEQYMEQSTASWNKTTISFNNSNLVDNVTECHNVVQCYCVGLSPVPFLTCKKQAQKNRPKAVRVTEVILIAMRQHHQQNPRA
jgi:hypothetical protein